MDLSKFKTHDWLVIGGGVGMLIFGSFVDWWSVSTPFGSASGGNAFDAFFTGTIPWILLVAAAVVTVLVVLDVLKRDQLPWPLILLAATVLAAFLLLLRVVFDPGFAGASRGAGMYLSFVSGVVAAVGGVMGYTASGGDLKDFTDVNKIKAAFSSGGTAGATSDSPSPTPPPPGPQTGAPDDQQPPPSSNPPAG